jgi:hypothetical protein
MGDLGTIITTTNYTWFVGLTIEYSTTISLFGVCQF